jgi:hypothetical protein
MAVVLLRLQVQDNAVLLGSFYSCCRNVEKLLMKLRPTRIGDHGGAMHHILRSARTKSPTSDVTWKMIDTVTGNLTFRSDSGGHVYQLPGDIRGHPDNLVIWSGRAK